MKSKLIGLRGALSIAVFLTLSGGALSHALADGMPYGSKKMSVSPMKANGSGISVRYRLEGTPTPGQPTSITLTLAGVENPVGATVRFVADSGLTLVGSSTETPLNKGEPTTLTVDVVPGDGIGYLHVFTSQNGVTGVTSIPVQTGKAALLAPANGELKQSPRGDKILTMPVK